MRENVLAMNASWKPFSGVYSKGGGGEHIGRCGMPSPLPCMIRREAERGVKYGPKEEHRDAAARGNGEGGGGLPSLRFLYMYH